MLFVCPSEYKKEITPDVLAGHRDWLKKAVADGVIVTAGRREPPTGGVIVLRAENADAAKALLAEDPFVGGGFAEYQTIGFNPTMGDIKG